jgi:hypothetical protein
VKILSLCCSAGLWDRVWKDAGHMVVPGCEIDPVKRRMYEIYCDSPRRDWVAHDIAHVAERLRGERFDGIIAGIPCQTRSRLNGCARASKLVDLLPALADILARIPHTWALLENVAALDLPGMKAARCDAMHYAKPHQSRVRWFTHSDNVHPPPPLYAGDAESLVAYPCVAGRLYGPRRAGVLQGHPTFHHLPFHAHQLQEALADGVHRGTAEAWIPYCLEASLLT